MNKFLFLLFPLIVILSSCKKSLEDKAKDVLEENIKKTLYYPESYNPADTRIDSVGTPFDNPKFIKEIAKVQKIYNELDRTSYDLKLDEDSNFLTQESYCHLKSESAYKNKKAEADKRKENIIKQLNGKRRFFGYVLEHTYRAQTNSGDIAMGKVIFFVDKDCNLIYGYNSDDEEYELFEKFMENLNEEK